MKLKQLIYSSIAILLNIFSTLNSEGQDLYLNISVHTWNTILETELGDQFEANLTDFPTPFNFTGTGKPVRISEIPNNTRDSFLELTRNGSPINQFNYSVESVSLRFDTEPSLTYEIQVSHDLSRWNLITRVDGDGQIKQIPIELAGNGPSYYRVTHRDTTNLATKTGDLYGFVYQYSETGELFFGSGINPVEGTVPAVGANVEIGGSTLKAIVDEDGRFFFNEAPSGIISVVVEKDNKNISEEFRIFADLVNTPYSHYMTRAEAFAILETAVLADYEKREQSIIIGLDEPIPAGSIVERSDLNSQLSDLSALISDEEPSWLFIIDSYSTSQWQHPIIVALVGDDTGKVSFIQHMELPTVNGFSPWTDYEALSSGDVIFRGTNPPGDYKMDFEFPLQEEIADPVILARNTAIPATPCDGKNGKLYAMFLNGNHESWSAGTINRIKLALDPEFSEIIPFTAGENWEKQYKNTLHEWYKTMDSCDTLAIIFSGHGLTEVGATKGKLIEPALPKGVIYFGSKERTKGGTGRVRMYPNQIIEPLNPMKACRLMIYIDACFSGSFVSTGGFSYAKTGPNKGKPVKIVSPITDYIPINLAKSIDVIAFSSADDITTAQARVSDASYFPKWFTTLMGNDSVSLVAEEFINKGIFTKPLDFDNIQRLVIQARTTANTKAERQQPKIIRRKSESTIPCGITLIPQEMEDNDTKETANPVETNEGKGRIIGSLEPAKTDIDHFVFIENADFFVVGTNKDHQITVEQTGANKVIGVGTVEFRILEPGQFTVSVSGGSVQDYDLDLKPIASAIRIENNSDKTLGMRLVTNEVFVNQGEIVILEPGGVYRESFEIAVSGYNIIDYQDSEGLIRGGDQEFDILIPHGTRQVFIIGNGFDEYFSESIH